MRKAVLALGVAVALALAVWMGLRATRPEAAPPTPTVSTTTAPVTRGDVARRVTISGVLGYDGHYPVVSHLPPGVVTAVPGPGTLITRGGSLFAVAGIPAVLLYGAIPAYRDFAQGMSDGADVRQLEENLVALGADPRHAIRVDDRFTSATAAAIQRWSSSSTLPLGRLVFLPGPVRVGEVAATVGGLMAPGEPVLAATSTTPVVTARVGTDRQHLLHLGDAVRVTLPAGEPLAGKVIRVGRTPTEPEPGATGTPSVEVTVQLPDVKGDHDRAPAQLQITVEEHHDVLMVPVTALLSAGGGGYQMMIVEDGLRRLIDVRPGLYDDSAGTVEITGPGVAEGTMVEVPVS